MRRGLVAAVSGAVLLIGATTAAASSTSAPEQVVEHGEVTLRGVIEEPPTERTGVAELRLTGPGATALPVARSARPSPQDPQRDPAQVTFPLRTAPCNLPEESCPAATVLPNGTWTLQLFEVDRAAGAPEVERGEASTFVVDVPAFPPQDVTATLEARTVTVAWARGVGPDQDLLEPDVRWTVDDGQGRTATVAPAACVEGRCRAAVSYPDDASGPRSFTVAASRPGAAPPTVTPAAGEVVVPAVQGGPSAGPTAGAPDGGTPGAPGAPGAAPGGDGQATAQSFAQGFNNFAPSLGLPKLPPLPETTAPSVAGPLVADEFDPTLGFEDRTLREAVPGPVAAPPGREGVLTSSGGGLLGDEQAVRSLAAAMVLLMGGAHLRTWLAGTRPTEL